MDGNALSGMTYKSLSTAAEIQKEKEDVEGKKEMAEKEKATKDKNGKVDKENKSVDKEEEFRVEELEFEIPCAADRSEIVEFLHKTKSEVRLWIEDLDVKNLTFDQFGKSEMKRVGVHPDTFVQIALQVAIYMTHKRYVQLSVKLYY
jgi:hypothetical protein